MSRLPQPDSDLSEIKIIFRRIPTSFIGTITHASLHSEELQAAEIFVCDVVQREREAEIVDGWM